VNSPLGIETSSNAGFLVKQERKRNHLKKQSYKDDPSERGVFYHSHVRKEARSGRFSGMFRSSSWESVSFVG
jgi:hypothetical protein